MREQGSSHIQEKLAIPIDIKDSAISWENIESRLGNRLAKEIHQKILFILMDTPCIPFIKRKYNLATEHAESIIENRVEVKAMLIQYVRTYSRINFAIVHWNYIADPKYIEQMKLLNCAYGLLANFQHAIHVLLREMNIECTPLTVEALIAEILFLFEGVQYRGDTYRLVGANSKVEQFVQKIKDEGLFSEVFQELVAPSITIKED